MRIGILGDLCLSYPDSSNINVPRILSDYGNSTILKELSKNDWNIVNLEAPITKSDKAITKTGPSITNPYETIDFLKISNIRICSLANNHMYDYGIYGLKETIEVCEKNNIGTLGAGTDPQKITEPFIISNDQATVGVIAFAENEYNTIHLDEKNQGTNGLDIINLFNQLKYAKSVSDFVIVIAHGGHEQYQYPSPRIAKTYRFLIDAGAHAVIAHHPHVVQGYEIYQGKPIFYSIGNYFFRSKKKISTNHEGMLINLEVSKNKLAFDIVPYTQCLDSFMVNIMDGEQKSEFLKRLDSLSKKITNNELQKEWENFLHARKEFFINALFPFNKKFTHLLVKYGLNKLFIPRKHFLVILNMIRCESHRDLMISSLKNLFYK